MSSFFKPPHGTHRKVVGVSLALGLTPLLALTPVAAQPAPASPAQQAGKQQAALAAGSTSSSTRTECARAG